MVINLAFIISCHDTRPRCLDTITCRIWTNQGPANDLWTGFQWKLFRHCLRMQPTRGKPSRFSNLYSLVFIPSLPSSNVIGLSDYKVGKKAIRRLGIAHDKTDWTFLNTVHYVKHWYVILPNLGGRSQHIKMVFWHFLYVLGSRGLRCPDLCRFVIALFFEPCLLCLLSRKVIWSHCQARSRSSFLAMPRPSPHRTSIFAMAQMRKIKH